MVVNTLMYIMFVIAGVIGGAVAWDDLVRPPKDKEDHKTEKTVK